MDHRRVIRFHGLELEGGRDDVQDAKDRDTCVERFRGMGSFHLKALSSFGQQRRLVKQY